MIFDIRKRAEGMFLKIRPGMVKIKRSAVIDDP